MMPEPIEETYLNWLYKKVAHVDIPTPSLTYWTLIKELHSFEFVWLLPGDDNRAEDGLDIRKEFLYQADFEYDPYWMNFGCSVLEMLIAFSRRAEFVTDLEAVDWFWIFLKNLKLDKLNDAMIVDHQRIGDILDRFVWRTYRYNGRGGLFPLRHAELDQRKVEIWYQFSSYLVEQEQV